MITKKSGSILRCIFIFLLTFSLHSLSIAETQSRSFVYDDSFVWHVARQLSDDLIKFQKGLGVKLIEGEWGELGMQYDILYRNYLVRCDGPLPQLAEILSSVQIPTGLTNRSEIESAYASAISTEGWNTLKAWEATVRIPLVTAAASAQYGFFPDCVVPGFKAQNQIPELVRRTEDNSGR
jgi:hypothetical protein